MVRGCIPTEMKPRYLIACVNIVKFMKVYVLMNVHKQKA